MAQTLKFGNGTWATKKGSTLAYNDENDNYKPLPFTTTRASGATRVNKEGLIEVVENDRPRIDYTDSAKGALLLEPQRTNLVTYSEDFSNAYWTKSGSSVTSGFTSPKGDLSAYKLVEDTSTSGHFLYNAQGGDSKTFSFFAKSLGNQYVAISYDGGNNFNFFDIINGQLGTITDSSKTSKIENYGNGWFRCSLYNGSSVFGATIWMSKDGINTSYAGDGTSGVYIYGAQLEVGSYPTSYIPTQGATATRVADTASGSGNSEVFSDSEGVLMFEGSFVNDTSFKGISISSGANANSIRIYKSNVDNQIVFRVRVGDVDQFLETIVLSNTSMYNKISLKYKENDYSAWVNGFEVATELSGSVFSSGILNTLDLSNAVGGDNFYGKTKELAYYNTALTDLELETLTSYSSLSELVTELNLNTL